MKDNRDIKRLFFIDWLRVFATLVIFLYHNNRIFTLNDWHIKNAQLSTTSSMFMEFLNLWIMPLFFVLSGASVYYSLKLRSTGVFAKERVWRIVVPWVLTGVFLMAPPQVYLERLSHGDFTGNFFQFIPHYFDGINGFGGNFAFHGMHLWYLMVLSIFSFVLLPLLINRKTTGDSVISRLGNRLQNPWYLLLLFVPIAIAAPIADILGLGFTRQMGSWDLLSYMMFFIVGYLLFSSEKIIDNVTRYAPTVMIIAILFGAAHIWLMFGLQPAWYEDIDFRPMAAWSWVLGLIGMGSRFLNFNNQWLGHINEAVLPFYILHQTAIIIVGYFVVQWDLGIGVKYLITASISFVAIVATYELVVIRLGITRFLFGMKLRNTINQ